jgi:penicillin amidase
MRRYLVRALAVLVGLVALGAIGGVLYFWRSLPVVNGTEVVAGASARIDIIRDADAIPHIFAATKADALFGLGYVHAQDRLWQMEFQRRVGHGRLSEILGPAAVPQDRFLRTVGFGRAARTAWASAPEWARAQVNAYVAGVNAFIATHRGGALPPEFTLLRFEPEPFTGEDVMVWVKMMAWDLCANYSSELLRADLVSRVGAERMAQLMPPYPADGLSILGAEKKLTAENLELRAPTNTRFSAGPVAGQPHRSSARQALVTAGGPAGGGAAPSGATRAHRLLKRTLNVTESRRARPRRR